MTTPSLHTFQEEEKKAFDAEFPRLFKISEQNHLKFEDINVQNFLTSSQLRTIHWVVEKMKEMIGEDESITPEMEGERTEYYWVQMSRNEERRRLRSALHTLTSNNQTT